MKVLSIRIRTAIRACAHSGGNISPRCSIGDANPAAEKARQMRAMISREGRKPASCAESLKAVYRIKKNAMQSDHKLPKRKQLVAETREWPLSQTKLDPVTICSAESAKSSRVM